MVGGDSTLYSTKYACPDCGINIEEIKNHILEIDGVEGVHHIHIWSLDGFNHYATMHIVSVLYDTSDLKDNIKKELKEHGIVHATIEFEKIGYNCPENRCNRQAASKI